VFGSAASCAFFAMLAVLASRLVLDEFQYDETSPAMGVPTWWYTIWLPICSAIITLRTAGMTVRAWRGQP
ncbi:MAG: TRAP transporter small permease subunit, partial [Comamonadaceae bacterium]